MSNFERYNGQIHNIGPTLLNRTVAEQIDDYQMKIYELMKSAHPNMVGYTAVCHECIDANGDFDVHTQLYMDRGGEDE